jgi:hypothetical protein
MGIKPISRKPHRRLYKLLEHMQRGLRTAQMGRM